MDKRQNPLHLIYLSTARIPSEKAHTYQILKMGEAFTQKGASVTLLHQRRKKHSLEEKAGNLFDYYGITSPFIIKQLSCCDWNWMGRINQRIQFYWRMISYLWVVAFFITYHRRSIDVIYCRDRFSIPLLAGIKMLSHFKLFYEAHEFPSAFPQAHIRLLKKMNGVIAVNEILRQKFLAAGFPAKKILVAHDGVDHKAIAFFRTRSRKILDKEKPVRLCYTGHLYPWKGCKTLVRAMDFLPGNFHLTIVGGTREDLEDLKEKTRSGNLHTVDYRGYVPPGEVPTHLAASDILVIPNSGSSPMSSLYTSPLKLFEYMASGRPMVASRVPSLCEILKDGGNAVLVEPDNPRELAAGIMRVARDQALANAIAEQALIDVEQYTWGKRAEKIIEFMSSRA